MPVFMELTMAQRQAVTKKKVADVLATAKECQGRSRQRGENHGSAVRIPRSGSVDSEVFYESRLPRNHRQDDRMAVSIPHIKPSYMLAPRFRNSAPFRL